MTPRVFLPVGFLIVVAVAGPTRGLRAHAAPEQSAPAPVDVCALVTVQEASAAIGETVKDGRSIKAGRSMMPNATASACEFQSATSTHSVQLNVWRAAPSAATQMQQMGQIVCGKKTKDGLAGLGDVACWYDAKHGELQVFKGPIFVSVEMSSKADGSEAMKTLAKKALERIK